MLNVPEMTYHAIALFCMRLALCHHDCLGPHRLLFSLLSEQPERKEELTHFSDHNRSLIRQLPGALNNLP